VLVKGIVENVGIIYSLSYFLKIFLMDHKIDFFRGSFFIRNATQF